MTTCPVAGCSATVHGYAFKSQAKYAAQLLPFIDMLHRLAEIWDSPEVQREFGHASTADDIRELTEIGGAIFENMHACAHRALADSEGRFLQSPSVEVYRRWKDTATFSCIALSVVDPNWCINYWTEQERSGVKVPLELRKGLRQTQVVL